MATYQAHVGRVVGSSPATLVDIIERQPVVRLDGKSVYRAERRSNVIRVLTGRAWITFDGQDWLVMSGEEITLTPGHDDAVIGSLNGKPLVFAMIG